MALVVAIGENTQMYLLKLANCSFGLIRKIENLHGEAFYSYHANHSTHKWVLFRIFKHINVAWKA